MFRKSYGSVGTLPTPSISSVVQQLTNYRITVDIGLIQSFYPITYEIFADGVSIASGTLASSIPAAQVYGAFQYDVGTYAQGKDITYKLTTLSQTRTSLPYTTSYAVFGGSFSSVIFNPVDTNAYTDPSEPTKYSWNMSIEDMITDAGYTNPNISMFFEWTTAAGVTYPDSQTITSTWAAHGGGILTFASIGAEGGAFAKLSPHTVSGGNKFRFHITVSAAGYSQTFDYNVFTNV